MYNMSLTWISTKVANTATGSTADMRAANSKQSNIRNSTLPYMGVNEKPHKVNPMHNVLNKVFAIANNKIVPMFSKNGLFESNLLKKNINL